MNVLKDKSYKNYNKISRYSIFPYYYNMLDNKYVYGITSNLDQSTDYSIYTVKYNDTYDSIAVDYYNNPSYYWVICDFNRIDDPFEKPEEGTKLAIPVLSTIQFL